MAGGGGGKGLWVSNIYCPHWRRKNGDEGIRAKLMVIFYSGSVRSVLSNTVITSLVRGERERERGRRETVVFVMAVNEQPGLIEW